MKRELEPYLQLIGFGELKAFVPLIDFLRAGVMVDQLEQTLAQIGSVPIDEWSEMYHSYPLTYTKFYDGWQALLCIPLTTEIHCIVEQLLAILPSKKTVQQYASTNRTTR